MPRSARESHGDRDRTVDRPQQPDAEGVSEVLGDEGGGGISAGGPPGSTSGARREDIRRGPKSYPDDANDHDV